MYVAINGEKFSGVSLDGLMDSLDLFCQRSNLRQVTYFVDTKNWRVHILHGDVIVWDVPIKES